MMPRQTMLDHYFTGHPYAHLQEWIPEEEMCARCHRRGTIVVSGSPGTDTTETGNTPGRCPSCGQVVTVVYRTEGKKV